MHFTIITTLQQLDFCCETAKIFQPLLRKASFLRIHQIVYKKEASQSCSLTQLSEEDAQQATFIRSPHSLIYDLKDEDKSCDPVRRSPGLHGLLQLRR